MTSLLPQNSILGESIYFPTADGLDFKCAESGSYISWNPVDDFITDNPSINPDDLRLDEGELFQIVNKRPRILFFRREAQFAKHTDIPKLLEDGLIEETNYEDYFGSIGLDNIKDLVNSEIPEDRQKVYCVTKKGNFLVSIKSKNDGGGRKKDEEEEVIVKRSILPSF